MAEFHVGKVAEFEDGNRKLLSKAGKEIVVFMYNGDYYAFDNYCLHMGGPVGEGILIGKVQALMGEDRVLLGETFSEKEIHIVCPWHGWEYDIETGACVGQPSRMLKRYGVSRRGDDVYVEA